MQNITHGQLRVLSTSHIYTFPAPGSQAEKDNDMPNLKAELRVVNDVFWLRLCTMSDLGFAEAYMYGDVECDDLVSLFLMFVYNRSNLASLNTKLSYLFTLPQKITSYRFLNTIGNSRSNISAHYDISNDMFAGFLSEDMTYSCAIFDDLDGDLKHGSADRSSWSGGQGLRRLTSSASQDFPSLPHQSSETLSASLENDTLYAAQLRKLRHIIDKARIMPNQRVLEIGSGWGALAILIAQTVPGTTVDTLTLSSAQQTLAEQRIAAAGLSDRVRVHLMDYRAMPAEWEGVFDRVVSIEMAEAVGKEFLETYWGKIEWAMKREGAVGVVQCITIPEPRFERYMVEIDFIRKWVIFPGGFLPTLTYLMETLQKGSQSRLIVDSVSNIGPHYARTLREWRRRFLAKFEEAIVPALVREHPEVMSGDRGREEVEVFKRKWICDCYCEVGFTTRTLGDHIVTFTREGYEDYGCQVYQ
ncbi:CFS1-like protein [Punctularia strigosozonata HHB-11173 SS5]|uniref:CFS1-like protein n=1 Tax=Punctularia strigosozonata (strain HHB-11173) TaxID=741275 RepID=UPI000441763C|nr:CFS1-like protein [Punctularia strigosozonata HHB-11173 SS5]EIN13054.1 CFS1-like protein [Punctularia strigosozonata HHB-11173 SS5]